MQPVADSASRCKTTEDWALRGDVKCLPAGVNVKFMNANEIDSYHIRGWEESQADTLDFEGSADRWQVGDMLL